jgi:hypothetical protein
VVRISNKDILIGYIGTLPDKECKEIYYLLQGKNTPEYEWVVFDKVKLTQQQYSKLIWLWGKDKLEECIKILNKWMVKKNIDKPLSCYKNLMGWVENAYYRTHPATDKSIRFNSDIDTAWKAKRYVQRIPVELRAYDTEIKYLVEKYGTDILK